MKSPLATQKSINVIGVLPSLLSWLQVLEVDLHQEKVQDILLQSIQTFCSRLLHFSTGYSYSEL